MCQFSAQRVKAQVTENQKPLRNGAYISNIFIYSSCV